MYACEWLCHGQTTAHTIHVDNECTTTLSQHFDGQHVPTPIGGERTSRICYLSRLYHGPFLELLLVPTAWYYITPTNSFTTHTVL